jgi:hypothetical protein
MRGMKGRRVLLGILTAMVLWGALAGCENPAAELTLRETGAAAVHFGLAGEAALEDESGGVRTAGPAGYRITKLALRFTPSGSGGAPGEAVISDPAAIGKRTTTIEGLEAGTYTISARAYIPGPSGGDIEFAVGEQTGTAVRAGEEAAAEILLGPTPGGEDGRLAYDLTIPAGAGGRLELTTEQGLAGGTIILEEGRNTGSLPLAPGYYRARVEAAKGEKTAVLNGRVCIYTTAESSLTREYTEDDLSGEGTEGNDDNNNGTNNSDDGQPGTGTGDGAPLKIKIMQDNSVTVTGDKGTNILVQGSGSSLSLSVPEAFTGAQWYVDGKSQAVSNGNSVVLNADAYAPGLHLVTFIGMKDGKPESQTLSFYVEAADSGRVSPEDLAEYLAALKPGTPEEPSVVALTYFDVSSNVWGTTIKNALAGSEKYIILDLSVCYSKSGGISGAMKPQNNNFNVIKTPYIVGVILPSSLTEIGAYAFYKWTTLKSVTIPAGVRTINSAVFSGCTGLTGIELPEGLTTLGDSVFSGCTGLTGIELPDGLTTIRYSAFYGCTGLTGIELPEGLTTLGGSVFYGCTGLTGIELHEGLTTIGDSVFSGCTGLTSIELPEGLSTIGQNAFIRTGLTSIVIPATVSGIGGGAFLCDLITVTFLGDNTTLADSFSTFNNNLDTYYENQSSKAGTYTWNGASWSKSPLGG